MKKIFLVITSISLLIASLSIAYYFTYFLPHKENVQKAYDMKLKKIQQDNSDIRSSIEELKNNTNSTETSSGDIQDSVQDTIKEELQNQANCEGLGGRYQGGGTCVYY